MNRRAIQRSNGKWQKLAAGGAAILAALGLGSPALAQNSDPLLDALIKKGILTEDEARAIKSEAVAGQTNAMPTLPSKWKLNDGFKSVELFGDVRLRFEDREAHLPGPARVDLQRGRFALRFGLRGEMLDDFYYGIRLETSSNPRSPWDTFGTSSSGVPYNGPYGKSTFGLNIGQAYIGWRPESWVDIQLGKMPQPLYTTPMVWDADLNPEGAAEKFKYTVGDMDLFATFAQFEYQDINPAVTDANLGFNALGQRANNIFQIAWQGGLNWHITTNLSAKIGSTLYQYMGLHQSSPSQAGAAPYFGDVFIGEGAFTGTGSTLANGAAGYNLGGLGNQGSLAFPSYGYPLNQTGLRHLLILEVPAEINLRTDKLNWRLFGDFSYNFEGKDRATEAAQGYNAFLASPVTFNPNLPASSSLTGFSPQKDDVKAYQIGLGVGSADLTYGPTQGLVYGTGSAKHDWEARVYYQHVEQYALDPNLLDSDFFEGRGNLEGIYGAVAYGLSRNVITSVRYGYATRINHAIGTGGSNLDIPQVNPIDRYEILQLDLSCRF